MNKQTMHAIRKQGQAGFTLIELIVVIVILGILAATALPKFANLGGDARFASLNAVRGALTGTASTTHGQWLINPSQSQVTNENTTVTFNTVAVGTFTAYNTGYPVASALTATAAGLTTNDYAITVNTGTSPTAASATTPAIPAHGMVVVPKSVVGSPSGATCFVSYTEASATMNGAVVMVTPPIVTVPAASTACQ